MSILFEDAVKKKKEEVLDLMDKIDKLHKVVPLNPERIEKIRAIHKEFESDTQKLQVEMDKRYELELRTLEIKAIQKEINLLNLWK